MLLGGGVNQSPWRKYWLNTEKYTVTGRPNSQPCYFEPTVLTITPLCHLNKVTRLKLAFSKHRRWKSTFKTVVLSLATKSIFMFSLLRMHTGPIPKFKMVRWYNQQPYPVPPRISCKSAETNQEVKLTCC